MRQNNFFSSLKSIKKGVGSGAGSWSGSISQRYGSGDPDPGIRIRIKMPRIPNTLNLNCASTIGPLFYSLSLPLPLLFVSDTLCTLESFLLKIKNKLGRGGSRNKRKAQINWKYVWICDERFEYINPDVKQVCATKKQEKLPRRYIIKSSLPKDVKVCWGLLKITLFTQIVYVSLKVLSNGTGGGVWVVSINRHLFVNISAELKKKFFKDPGPLKKKTLLSG